MTGRETLSTDYLYFRFPTEYLLMLLPPIIGIWSHVFGRQFFIVEIISMDLIHSQMTVGINGFLGAAKLTFYLLIAFFFCYRWSAMRKDGSFAFWISLGIIRKNFFIKTVIKFSSLLVLGEVFGVLIVIYLNYYILAPLSFIYLILGIISHILLTLSFAILISTFVDQAEIAALGYLLVMGIFYFLFIDADNLINWILHSDMRYNSSMGWVPIGIAIAIASILFGISYRSYYLMDIET